MRNRIRIRGWLLSGVLSIATTGSAIACAFHGYTPNPTLVDALLGTEQVVIAGLSPSDSKRYVPLDTLLGQSVADLPIAVDRAMGMRLKIDPSATVLLARDGSYGPWVEIAVLDKGYRNVVEEILLRQSPWLYGDGRERLSFFAERLNDPNPDIRRLALRELDRAPYAELRRLRLPVVQGLSQDIRSGDSDLTPIRVLLAGLSGDPRFGPILLLELDKAIRNKVPYLGAYATALIELEGKVGVQKIRTSYLEDESLTDDIREKLLQALAIQYKTAPRPTRRFIAHEVADLSRNNLKFGEAAARHFGVQRGWRLASPGPPAGNAPSGQQNFGEDR